MEGRSIKSSGSWVNLASFSNPEYDPGRGLVVRALWYCVSLFFFESGFIPISKVKRGLLRLFGASIGRGVVIKPHVRIKFPWRLSIGDHCWIGQGVWIDNMADVRIGAHVCVSQGAYFCTGSHDYRRTTFDLVIGEIVVEDGAWIAAKSLLLPGVLIGANSLVAAGSVVTKDIPSGMIAGGNPAKIVRPRETLDSATS